MGVFYLFYLSMPQLDTLTYLSQLFGFYYFCCFYAMVVRHILPALSTAIKLERRNYKLIVL